MRTVTTADTVTDMHSTTADAIATATAVDAPSLALNGIGAVVVGAVAIVALCAAVAIVRAVVGRVPVGTPDGIGTYGGATPDGAVWDTPGTRDTRPATRPVTVDPWAPDILAGTPRGRVSVDPVTGAAVLDSDTADAWRATAARLGTAARPGVTL